jgi:hypothetical protein
VTVEEARAAVLRSMPFRSWIDTELITCSRRQKRRHEIRAAQERAEHVAECARLQAIADLPDADLRWLLDAGWTP